MKAQVFRLAAFTALLAALPPAAWSQAYPSKPIRIVVPFPPGGAVDFFARVVQNALAESLGQPVVIDNRGGAGGMVGAGMVAKAAPDGHTLVLGNIASMAINVGIYPSMPYDPIKDFTPILRTVNVNYVLAAHPSTPFSTVQELIAYARAQPGRLSYGSAGSGSLPHLGTELIKAQAGIDMLHVPYKGGGPMVTDLVGGVIQLSLGDQANLMPYVQSGKLKALAVATAARSPNAPSIPTIAESGLPGFEATAWQGLLGPAGMEPAVVKQLNDALNRVMNSAAIRDKLVGGGLDPIGGTPEDFGRFIAQEIAKWTALSRSVGARAD